MAQLSLALFGPALVTIDGLPLESPLWAKTLALLAYLALEDDRPHRREALAGLLWPEQTDAEARASLRQALYLLRQAIGNEFLQVTGQTARFNHTADVRLDVAEFERLITTCQDHPHRGLQACPACAARLERAAALYRGDLLAGLLLKDSIEFEEWLLVRREQLRRQLLEALDALAGFYARRGDYARTEQAARRQVELEPLHEQAHRQLLRALAWSGRPNAALAHYVSLQEMLERELGAPPEEKTSALEEQIRAGTLLPPATRRLQNWPTPLTALLGREKEMAALADWLQAPEPRLITIVGPGGVGKTRLALEAAAQEAPAFAEGACFVPLAAISAPDYIVPAIASALGVSFSGPGDPLAQLIEALHTRDLVLVLDNYEHLLEGASLVTELLAACPGLAVLATSREPLHLRAEQLFPLEPLDLPDLKRLPGRGAARIDELSRVPAVALFDQRARAAQPHFTFDEENAGAIAEICVCLDGLPLAIELAAARVRLIPVPEILTRLSNRLALLVGGARDLPPRQRALRATLDWSYDLLEEKEKELFARLSVFAGGGTMEAVQAICLDNDADNLPDELFSLVEKSLLQRQEAGSEARFVMLETVREYAREKLVASGELGEMERRHATYYQSVATLSSPDLFGPRPEPLAQRLEADLHNLRAAVQWALDREAIDVALHLTSCMWWFWHRYSGYVEGEHWLEAALRLPFASEPDSEAWTTLARQRVEVLTGAGVIVNIRGRYAQAISYLEEAAALARQIGETDALPRILAWLGRAADTAGDLDRALRAYQEGLALARAGGPERRRTVAFCLNAMGPIYRVLGNYSAARACQEESLVVWQEVDNQEGYICGLCNLGVLEHFCGDEARAVSTLQQSLRLAWETHSTRHVAYSLFGLAVVRQAQGESVQAARLLGTAEATYRSVGADPMSGEAELYAATVAALNADLGEEACAAERAWGQQQPLGEVVRQVTGPPQVYLPITG